MKPTILLVLFFVCMTTALVAQSVETIQFSKTWEQSYPVQGSSPLHVKVTISAEKMVAEGAAPAIKVLSRRIELSAASDGSIVVTRRAVPQGGDPNPDVPARRFTILAVKSELKDSVPAEVRKYRHYIEESGVCFGYDHLDSELFIGTPMVSIAWKMFSAESIDQEAVDTLMITMERVLAYSKKYASGGKDSELDLAIKKLAPQLRELVASGIPALFVEE